LLRLQVAVAAVSALRAPVALQAPAA